MLVCPQCHLENPNHSKYCQQCGTSLTHQSCPQCQEKVPLNLGICQGCGAIVGTVWQAVIAQRILSRVTSSPNPQTEDAELTLNNDYLDSGQRYRLLVTETNTSLTVTETHSSWCYLQGQVIDCQPLQKSVLAVLLDQSSDLFTNALEKTESSANGKSPMTQWQAIGIPDLVLPYLTLQDLSPIIPLVHDAWLEEDKEVILLSDRRHWQTLSAFLLSEELQPLQSLYWLNKIATLWKALVGVNCCQSLLIDDNLRIDEDQSLGLQQLYPDNPEQPPSLQDLGQLWQTWFQNAQSPPSESLIALIEQLVTGKLDNLTELRLQLQDLATEQQTALAQTEEEEIEPEVLEEIPAEIPIDFASDLRDNQTEPLEEPSQDLFINSEILENSGELATDILPMQLLSLDECGMTDRGRQRPHNEDYFEIKSEIQTAHSNQGKTLQARGLYIVCDGMGGHAAGEVASRMAVESLHQFFEDYWHEQLPTHETVCQGILETNQRLYEVNQRNASSGSGRMGTTLVLALIEGTKVAIAHVGDSRVYRLSRQRGLEQLTVDHEVGQKAIQNGVDPEIAYGRPDAYQLTQALGPHDNTFIQPDIHFLDVQEDSLFLLCSDGLSDNELIESHWQTYLAPLLSSRHSLEQGLHKLIEFANRYNGHDNITAILVRVKVQPKISLNN